MSMQHVTNGKSSIASFVSLFTGMVGIIGAGAICYKNTIEKLPEIVKEKREINCILMNSYRMGASEEEDAMERVASIKKCERAACIKTIKLYGLPAGIGVISLAGIMAGMKAA